MSGEQEIGGKQRIVKQEDVVVQKHFGVLGWILIVAGAAGIMCIPMLGTAAMRIRDLLPSLSPGGPATAQPDPLWAAIAAPALLAVEALIVAAVSALCIVAGAGLMKRKPWARALAILASVLLLPGAPVGTIIGIYGLWLMLSYKGRQAWAGYVRSAPG